MLRCVVCNKPARGSALCGACREMVAGGARLVPEQLWSVSDTPVDAAVVDQWGRIHNIGRRTLVSRKPGPETLTICDGSVSRNHAVIEVDLEHQRIRVRDLGSTNGTFVREQAAEPSSEVESGDLIHFGAVGLYLISPAPNSGLFAGAVSSATLRQPVPIADVSDADEDLEATDVGMPRMDVSLVEPSGGGGGFLRVGPNEVQLSVIQTELIQVLLERMIADRGQSELVRGFVRSSELIGTLSWETPSPNENHLKQLVRRTRRALDKANIGDLIESRHRLGYRLKAIPE